MKLKRKIQIEEGEIVNAMSAFVEKIVIQNIKENRSEIIIDYFKSIPEKMQLEFLRPTPLSPKFLGNKGKRSIARWHGDVAMIVHTPEKKVAFIFEIKFGHTHISKPQHNFFQGITSKPEEYLKKLDAAVIYIVHCYNLDLKNGTIEVIIEPYRGGVVD